jgi:hypothetical protein
MAINGRQMTTTMRWAHGVLDCMGCQMWYEGVHHVNYTYLWVFKILYISYSMLLSDRREDHPPLDFHEIGCGYVHFLNIVHMANHSSHGNVKVDKPLGSCIMYLTKATNKVVRARALTIATNSV